MNTWMRRAVLPMLMLLLAAGLAWARVILCPRCGHEVEETARACPHCQNALAAAAPAPASAEAPVVLRGGGILPAGTIERGFAAVRKALEDEQPALAWLQARQLAGLMALEPSSAPLATERSRLEREALVDLVKRERVCPVCQGEGGMMMLFVTVNGSASQQKAPGQKCPACQGAGHWKAHPTAEQLQLAFAQAQRVLNASLREQGWALSGNAWLPPDTADLKVTQLAALRRAVAGPCENCRGTGGVGCEACRGSGRLRCGDGNCVSGRVICPDCQGTRRMRVDEDGRSLTRRCTTCRQTGVVDCPVCEGRAYRICATCEGRGEEPCSVCKGGGEKSLCRSCSGEGLRACKRCKGSGTYRDAPCAECRGDGHQLCSACNGSGRGK